MRYQLEGQVSGIYGEGPSVVNLGLNVGDYVKYVFVVDKTKPACIHYENVIDYLEDTDNNYFAKLIDISYQLSDTYYNFNNTNYYATDISSPSGTGTTITAGPPLLFVNSSSYLVDWEEGDQIFGTHYWHDSTNDNFITMHIPLILTLKSIDKSEYSECGDKPVISDGADSVGGGGSVNVFTILFLSVLLCIKSLVNSSLNISEKSSCGAGYFDRYP